MALVSQLHLMRLVDSRYEPIDKGAWREAIEATPGVRLVQGGEMAPNLRTGGSASLWQQIPCDAEVAVLATGDEPTWLPLFSWQDSGSAIVNRVFDPTDGEDPRTQALFAVAEALGASVTDDTGQVLTLPT
jgi:hypothetical protein